MYTKNLVKNIICKSPEFQDQVTEMIPKGLSDYISITCDLIRSNRLNLNNWPSFYFSFWLNLNIDYDMYSPIISNSCLRWTFFCNSNSVVLQRMIFILLSILNLKQSKLCEISIGGLHKLSPLYNICPSMQQNISYIFSPSLSLSTYISTSKRY
jgi:hypothetical protein